MSPISARNPKHKFEVNKYVNMSNNRKKFLNKNVSFFFQDVKCHLQVAACLCLSQNSKNIEEVMENFGKFSKSFTSNKVIREIVSTRIVVRLCD